MIALTLVLTYTAIFQQATPPSTLMLNTAPQRCAGAEAYVNFTA